MTNGPMSPTLCSGTNSTLMCSFTGLPSRSQPTLLWRMIKRNDSGYVVINETFFDSQFPNGLDVKEFKENNTLRLFINPVINTYNNTSHQCILMIRDVLFRRDIIIKSTVGTITVIGM